MRVLLGVEYGFPGADISAVIGKASNVDLTVFQRDMFAQEKIDLDDFDIVFIYGPHIGSNLPVLRELANIKRRSSGPRLIWWMNENLPPFDSPYLNAVFGHIRGWMDRLSPPPPVRADIPRRWHYSILHRYRLLHEVMQAKKWGVLDCLVATSAYRAVQFERLGVPSGAVPMGYGPSASIGTLLGHERTIDVLFLGSTKGIRARRRAKKLAVIESELRARGVKLKVISGGLKGQNRTDTLNQTRILLNLVRSNEDWTGHRLLLGAANGAMIVSEFMVDSEPFVDRTHIAFTALSDVCDTIMHYLQYETERRQIAQNAYRLVTDDLSMENCVSKVFEQAGERLKF